jgi:hypothetical protein
MKLLSFPFAIIALSTVALSVGCGKNSGGGEEPDTGTRSQPEGAFPGECDDGADNDFDGEYDCNDADCEGAPDCSENCDDGDCTDSGDTGSGASYPAVVDVKAGGQYACALFESGDVQCWGNNTAGAADQPLNIFDTVTPYDLISGPRSCGVTTTGAIECWGREFDYTFEGSPFDGAPLAGSSFVQVAHSYGMLCGRNVDGLVDCITDSHFGSFSLPGNMVFSDIDVELTFGCGVTDTSSLECWGTAHLDTYNVLSPPTGSYTQVGLGNSFGCALRTDGFVECWGDDGNVGFTEAPSIQFESISVGASHSCGVTTDKTVTCWGANGNSQCNAPLFQQFQSVDVGDGVSCGLTIEGDVDCWGYSDWDIPSEI